MFNCTGRTKSRPQRATNNQNCESRLNLGGARSVPKTWDGTASTKPPAFEAGLVEAIHGEPLRFRGWPFFTPPAN